MSEEKKKHVDYLRNLFFSSNEFIHEECKYYLKFPKFKDLYIGYIQPPKKMHVLDEESNERYIY